MNIAYVRWIFPKSTETFLMEELVSLKRQGHNIRIFALRGEFSAMHSKVIEEGLLENVIYHSSQKTESNDRSINRTDQPSYSFRQYFKNYFPGRPIWAQLTAALGSKCRKASISRVPLTLISDICRIVSLSRFIGNLSLAISQYIAEQTEFIPDLIHCPFTFQWDVRALIRLVNTHPGTPFTISLRSRDFYTSFDNEKFAKAKERLLRRANKLITISHYNRQIILKAFPRRKNVPIIHSSIDPAFFSPRLSNKEKRGNQIISVARLVKKKGLDQLIEACAILRDAGLEFHCRIVGDGPLKDDLKKLIAERGLADYVQIDGLVVRDVIRGWLDRSDVFVLPCIVAPDGDRDILPSSLKEAMAMRLPVVTSDISGIDELITDGINGILVPPASPRAIADAITALFGDEALREKLGNAAREKILKDFNIEIEGRKLDRILSAVSAKAREKARQSKAYS